jgi:hypothetical protein
VASGVAFCVVCRTASGIATTAVDDGNMAINIIFINIVIVIIIVAASIRQRIILPK